MLHTQSSVKTSAQSSESQLAAFIGVSGADRFQIGRKYHVTNERKLSPHEHVFLDGDAQTHVFQVLEGVVGVYKLLCDGRRQIVKFCYPGDMIGLDQPDRCSQHAEALSTASVRCIPVTAVDKLMREEPGFAKSMLQLLSSELAETREQLMSLGRKSALEKLATFLVSIAKRNALSGQASDQLYLPMKRSEIADHLGLTIETVSRNFTKLKASQVLRLCSNSEVQILDMSELESIADGLKGI